jgi:hypothetical protein
MSKIISSSENYPECGSETWIALSLRCQSEGRVDVYLGSLITNSQNFVLRIIKQGESLHLCDVEWFVLDP